jgi:hypothetical protein
MEDDLKIFIVERLVGSSSNLKLKLSGPNKQIKLLVIKTALNERRPPYIKSTIS